MSAREASSQPKAERESNHQTALVAAYREGLGLAAVSLIRSAAGIRIVAAASVHEGLPVVAEQTVGRWWCRRAADAERLARAVTAQLRRCESSDEKGRAGDEISAARLAAEAVATAAQRLNIALHSDDDVSSAAAAIIARVDEELARLRDQGDLKAVNRSYRSYRTEASARGDKVVPYAQWLSKYRQNLVRQAAAALRYI
jgi:hypothetical protein